MDRDEAEFESPEDEGIPDIGRPHPRQRHTGDEGLMVPRDQPRAADDAGTTAQEQRQGASLDERLTEEEEEGGEPGARPAAGRLREQGSGLTDQEKDEVADEAEDDTEGRSAEEAAVRLEDTPGGSTGGPDTYVQEDQGRSP